MNKFLDKLDKYKYGLIAALGTYMAIFVYTNLVSYKKTYIIQGWDEKAELIQEPEEIELKPEQIDLASAKQSDVKNWVNDQNDSRERSSKEYSESEAFSKDPEKAIKELEAKYKAESGESEKRDAIRAQMEIEKKKLAEQEKIKGKKDPVKNQAGGNKAYGGETMVSFSLQNRSPFENNSWHIRNPGYTCGSGASGKVTMRIKVDPAGRVISANFDQNLSTSTDPCMLEQAEKYARMSRFNANSTAGKVQEGTITYTFIAQ